MKFRQFLSRFLLFLPLLAMGACSSNKQTGDTVMKLPNYYYLDPGAQIASPDEMVRFESRHYLHGAISNDDRRAREGHYYTFPWKTSDQASPAALLFEYRQQNTGALVHALRVPIDSIKRKNVTRVEIVGEPYALNGKVTAWRASIERNGASVTSRQSYLWD
jgi:hypothetical protein